MKKSTFEEQTYLQKVKGLTIVVIKELKKKPILLVSVIGATITRLISVLFSSYLILWIQTFVDAGLLENENVGKDIYTFIMVASALVSVFVFPMAGFIVDYFPSKYTVPGSFIFRCLTTFLFWCIERPDTTMAYTVCIMMVVGTIIENIAVDSIFNKNLPKETRGLLSGVYSFGGQVGILIYSFLAGYLFDKIGPKSPFILIGVLDAMYAIYVIIFSLKNKME